MSVVFGTWEWKYPFTLIFGDKEESCKARNKVKAWMEYISEAGGSFAVEISYFRASRCNATSRYHSTKCPDGQT